MQLCPPLTLSLGGAPSPHPITPPLCAGTQALLSPAFPGIFQKKKLPIRFVAFLPCTTPAHLSRAHGVQGTCFSFTPWHPGPEVSGCYVASCWPMELEALFIEMQNFLETWTASSWHPQETETLDSQGRTKPVILFGGNLGSLLLF